MDAIKYSFRSNFYWMRNNTPILVGTGRGPDPRVKSRSRPLPPTAQAIPLPELIEDAPLRAEPLPLPAPKIIADPSLGVSGGNTAESFSPITKKGIDPSLPLPPKVVAENSRLPPQTTIPPVNQAVPAIPGSVPPGKTPLAPPKNVTAPTIITPPTPSIKPPPPQEEIQLPKQPSRPTLSSNTGVVALLDKADDLAASGQVDTAAVTLERALRIEPENGRLWHELAGIRLKQGRVDAAISFAERSNSFARNQRELQARNWRLIAVARKKQGQDQAATEALNRARALE